jgi:hypothetical protein
MALVAFSLFALSPCPSHWRRLAPLLSGTDSDRDSGRSRPPAAAVVVVGAVAVTGVALTGTLLPGVRAALPPIVAATALTNTAATAT